MENLIKHITKLLYTNRIVLIPGFGGFIIEESSSIIKGDMIYPPYKKITFNPAIQHNDGLLFQEYAEQNNISIEAAGLLAQRDIQKLKEIITNFRVLQFGKIGCFYKNEDSIYFEQNIDCNFESTSFGLAPICFPKIEIQNIELESSIQTKSANITEPEQTETTQLNNIYNKQNSFGIWSKIAAVIALIVLLNPFATNNNSTINQNASIIPLPTPAITNDTYNDNITLVQNDSIQTSEYHIVIASFYTNAKAKLFIEEESSKFETLYIINSEHRYRVCCKKFSEELDCESFLENFTVTTPKYADAWVLTIDTQKP